MISIRPAVPAEAATLSALALRSKAYWGYNEDFMAAFKAELTVDPANCKEGMIKVAYEGPAIVGFYQLSGSGTEGELEDLFVDPDFIGKGVGTLLLETAMSQAKELGFLSLSIQADPNAEGFYIHFGAKRIGTKPSGSIKGRELPLLLLKLS